MSHILYDFIEGSSFKAASV